MDLKLHANATTTPRIRAYIQQSMASVAALAAEGIATSLCSGDAAPAVARMADAVGIDARRARQSPEDKLAHVRERQAAGEVVAEVAGPLRALLTDTLRATAEKGEALSKGA